jgi:hypothetical protein
MAVGTRCADDATPLYPLKLALTSPTSGGRSVGIVRSRTKAIELLSLLIPLRHSRGRHLWIFNAKLKTDFAQSLRRFSRDISEYRLLIAHVNRQQDCFVCRPSEALAQHGRPPSPCSGSGRCVCRK